MKRYFFCFLCLIFAASIQAQVSAKSIRIVFIGNSITYGACLKNPESEAPPVAVINKLKADGYTVQYANCAISGKTTVDFLPCSGDLFHSVVLAADKLYKQGEPLLFSIMLGTNDSAIKGPTGAPVSPDQYKENLRTIIDSLHNRYLQSYFILHRPLWYSPNTHNAAIYLEEGLWRLQTYTPMLNILSQESPYVLQGDRDAFNFFKKKPLQYYVAEKGKSGVFYLHPNAAGAKILGQFWAKNIEKQLQLLHKKNKRG